MWRLDRDALLCDLAETYNIYDVKAVPVSTLARLSCGLRENSRIKLKMSGAKLPFETMVMIGILDELRWMKWSKTKDAQKNRKQPKSLLNQILNEDKVTSFATAEEFEKRLKAIQGGNK